MIKECLNEGAMVIVYQRIVTLFLLFFTVSLFAVQTPSSTHIIRFEGNTYFDTDTLVDVAGAKGRSFFQFWKDDTAHIDDRLIPTLEETLRNFYESEGFYHAKIAVISISPKL